MIKLLIQSDDYGITNGVSSGIIEGIKNGLIKNTGIFVNMPNFRKNAEQIKNIDVCLGIDINYVCGKPVTNQNLIPNMVDNNGNFYKSGDIKKRNKIISTEFKDIITIFERDPYPYEEVYLETDNQVKKFINMFEKVPEYMHVHSLCTPNTVSAAIQISNKYGIKHSFNFLEKSIMLPNTFESITNLGLQNQITHDVKSDLLDDMKNMKDGYSYMYICHCGYVDADIFNESSLTLKRVKDLEAILHNDISSFIKNNKIELITYNDI